MDQYPEVLQSIIYEYSISRDHVTHLSDIYDALDDDFISRPEEKQTKSHYILKLAKLKSIK